ncbi:MAG: hypothetical protein GC136_06965 [Alphaproteobacteria bacterium]|nr:hypothetical protein [Alphaproteobacteria bacterium]
MVGDLIITRAFTDKLLGLSGNKANASDKAKAPDAPKSADTASVPQSESVSVDPRILLTQSLNEKANNIQKILDGIEASIKAIQTARAGVDQITGIVEEAGGVAVRARNAFSTESDKNKIVAHMEELLERFGKALEKIDAVVDRNPAVGPDKANLLKGDVIATDFTDDDTGRVLTQGDDVTARALGLEANFSSLEGTVATYKGVLDAIEKLQQFGNDLNNSLSVIQTRQEFSQYALESLTGGAEKLTLADYSEEAAALLSLQIRQQLSGTSVGLATDEQRAVLSNF